LVAIGVTTPMAVLAVNGAAFVMRHLVQFRAGIASAALISSLLLNSVVAFAVIRFAQRNVPLLYAEYKRWALGLAVVIVGGTSGAAAYLTYLGMDDPKRLPDRTAIFASVLALGVPFAVNYIARRYVRRRELDGPAPDGGGGRSRSGPSAPNPRGSEQESAG